MNPTLRPLVGPSAIPTIQFDQSDVPVFKRSAIPFRDMKIAIKMGRHYCSFFHGYFGMGYKGKYKVQG